MFLVHGNFRRVNDPASAEFEAELALRADALAREGIPALAALYDLVADRLLGYAMFLTRNQNEAEDVLQASFLKLVRNPRGLNRADFPWSYLLKVVRNEALTFIAQRKPHTSLPPELLPLPAEPQHWQDWERAEAVQAALQQLPQNQAEVISLKIWEGLTFREIALVTDTQQAAVCSRYRYGLTKLATLLKAHAEPELAESFLRQTSPSVSPWSNPLPGKFPPHPPEEDQHHD